uniref:FAM13A-like domain-containing protein n=2 Tax=Musca domestica TaxID=7370 RepID=T1PLG9_MUSDO
MTPRIISYFLCGMRHPNTGLSEDDLSRLTGSSSSSASCRSNNCNSTSSSSSSSSSSSASSSSASSSSSSSASSSGANTPEECKHINKSNKKHNSPSKHHHHQHHVSTIPSEHLENNKNTQHHQHHHHHTHHQQQFNSTYLPEIINPLEWQKSRKRKERLDSTSSTIQDRKLQRSNSEELLPPDGTRLQNNNNVASTPADLGVNALKSSLKNVENIRRVSSEDFKRTPYEVYEQELRGEPRELDDGNSSIGHLGKTSDENDGSLANRQQRQQQSWTVGVPIKDMTRRSRYETSPARSQRHSPIRVCFSNGNGSKQQHRDSDDSECEHERRRSSERFCKSRAPPGRKASGVTKKSTSSTSAMKYLPSKLSDENVYKYDLSALKYERRGFISKKSSQPPQEKSNNNDLNDNNLIDFNSGSSVTSATTNKSMSKNLSPTTSSNGSTDDVHHTVTAPPPPQPMALQKTSTSTSSANSSKSNSQSSLHKVPHTISAQESLPWDRSVPEDQTPVLSRRYATVRPHYVDSIDTAAKLSKVKPYPQPHLKQNPMTAQLLANDLDDDDVMDPSLTNFRAFTTLENIKTRELMQQVLPNVMSFQSPEERMRQINKRVTALKKKLGQLEDSYEQKSGYKPSQADRLNDKYMKNILSELSKLRKERHELKTDPMSALGLKVSGGMDAEQKLQKMKVTLREIEQSLAEKRKDHNRPEILEELTADQLVQEKTTVQHGLLFFESLYGRPATKDERDAARPLYDRYRQLKRMVSRSVTLSGSSAAGAPELPTILEHEAMVFESTPLQYSSANSTETTNSPTESAVPTTNSSDESTTTTTAQSSAQQQQPKEEQNETISCLSIENLWEQLEKTREEKKQLKRVIRDFETVFEEQNGRKMLKSDRKTIEETYAQYKEKKAKTRLLQALIKKQISR